MEAITCQICSTNLLPLVTERNQLVRCADCGHTFMPELSRADAREKTDRMARWSFWLGLSSLLLCAITGIPALIMGVRSLRRMRFRSVQKKEKVQAITGTVLGVLCGCIGGLLMLSSLTLVGIGFATFEATKDPIRVAEIADGIVQMEAPTELMPHESVSLMGQTSTKFGDTDDKDTSNLRLLIIEMHFQPQNTAMASTVDRMFVGERSSYQELESEKLDWEMAGEESVKKSVYQGVEHKEDEEAVVVKYAWQFRNGSSWFAACIVHRIGSSPWNESQIKGFMESLRPEIMKK